MNDIGKRFCFFATGTTKAIAEHLVEANRTDIIVSFSIYED